MEQKMAELKALQSTVEDLLKKRSDEEESRLPHVADLIAGLREEIG